MPKAGRLFWVLDEEGIPRKVRDVHEWAAFFEKKDRFIAQYERDGYLVSTVFLGVDHNWGDGPPLLFETMVFDDSLPNQFGDEMDCVRASTKDDALINHERMVKELDRKLDYADEVAKAYVKSPSED
jgi:hypothetical protein